MFELGQRVRLTKPVAFSDGGAAATIAINLPAGATGTVTDCGDELNHWVMVKMDEAFPCLDVFDNCVTFDLDDDDSQGVGLASEYLAKV